MSTVLKNLGSVLLMLLIGAAAGLGVASLLKARTPTHIEGNYQQLHAEAGKSVILLGTAWCGYCEQTRAHLRSNGVEFADWDVEQSATAEERLRELGGQGVPVVVIGNRQIRGFRVEAIDAALQLLRNQEGKADTLEATRG